MESRLSRSRPQISGDTIREANSNEVAEIRKENSQLKELVADLSLKNNVLKKSLHGLESGMELI